MQPQRKKHQEKWRQKQMLTALLPRAALTECLELSQVSDLETCDDKIWTFFQLATDSIYLFERRFDEACKHENNITTSFFSFCFWNHELEEKQNWIKLNYSNMKRHRRFNITKTTNARRPFAECSQAYFRTWWTVHWPETHMTVSFCFQPSSSSRLQSLEFPYHPE